MHPAPYATAHMWEIEALVRPRRTRRVAKRWVPLYCYTNETQAIRAFRIIMSMTDKELAAKDAIFDKWEVEDVRLVKPNMKATFAAARKARRKGATIARSHRPRQALTRPLSGRTGALDGRLASAVVVGRNQRHIQKSGMPHARLVGKGRNK